MFSDYPDLTKPVNPLVDKSEMAIAEQLRRAVKASELSGNALAKAAGISQPALSRFMQGEAISLAAADKLAAYFGLALAPNKPTKPGKRK